MTIPSTAPADPVEPASDRTGAYRVGRRNPRNLYLVDPGSDDHHADEHVGVMFHPDDGPMVVAALNAHLGGGARAVVGRGAKPAAVTRSPIGPAPTTSGPPSPAHMGHGHSTTNGWPTETRRAAMPVDLSACLAEIAAARTKTDVITVETARLGEIVATRFQEEFASTLDMETCGLALVLAASAVVPLCRAEMPATVVANLIALAGEQLVREARDG